MTRSKLWSAVVFGSFGLVACSKQAPEPQTSYTAANDPTMNEPSVADPVAQPALGTTSGYEPAPIAGTTDPSISRPATGVTGIEPSAPLPLTDGQIAKVAETVDEGEIDQAKEVQKKAKNPQVKKLAAEMIQHHTKNKQKGQTLVRKGDLTPENSPVSEELSAKAEKNLQSIKEAAAPAEAERAYVDAQVAQHEEVLELLNTRLIPSAMNADLKAQLEETRKMVEKHMQQAKKVQQAISTETGAAPPAG